MSVINNALTDIEDRKSTTHSKLEKASIPKVRQTNRIAWAVGGFTLSLCLGGWAVSQQEPVVKKNSDIVLSVPSIDKVPDLIPISVDSPTAKVVSDRRIEVYVDPSPTLDKSKVANTEKESKNNVMHPEKGVSRVLLDDDAGTKKSQAIASTAVDKSVAPTYIAQVAVAPVKPVAQGEMAVEQVELSPKTLADNAIERGKKALDSNELTSAITEFETAIKYFPADETTRKRLAALYYGRKDIRRSVDVLQQGILLNENSQDLRMSLSKILIKEGQPEAALSPLVYLPRDAKIGYLELRAALSQQVKNNELAAETYQILTKRSPENARWWLGLAIQQERNLEYKQALSSYQEALNKVGVSKQTQAFIRDRLNLLESLQGEQSAN